MAFPWTIQRYIVREMGKTFLLAAVALTGVVGLGGGVLNMIRLGEVTPAQLGRLMALLLPLAAGLTLPIAALFAAAATYGRFSADNEFVACRSGGINMHVLFVPTVVLSLLAGALCFGLTNYLVPGMVRNLNQFLGADVGTFLRQQLRRPRGIGLGDFRIHADECLAVPSDPNQIVLQGVAFVEIDGDDWVRYGTARQVAVRLDRTATHIRLAGQMAGLSYYDRRLQQFVEEAQQSLPSNEIPSPLPQKEKFLNLNELLGYLARPDQWHVAQSALERLRVATGRMMAGRAIWRDWEDDHKLTIADARTTYRISAERGFWVPGDVGIELADAAVEEHRAGRRRSITAGRAVIEITRGETVPDCAIRLEVRDARLTDGATTIERVREPLSLVSLPPSLVAEVQALGAPELLQLSPPGADDPLAELRARAREVRRETLRRMRGTISERTAFSLSVFVLVILAAALGIIFRGSHAMTAFGISFVPMLFVILVIVAGKQMCNNAATHLFGLVVMWSGLAVVAAVDVWALRCWIRR